MLNQESRGLSIYEMDLNVSGELTQLPGSPFPLHEASGYKPTGIAVPGGGTELGIYITSSSSNPSMGGTLTELYFDEITGTVTSMVGSPLMLNGEVQPTSKDARFGAAGMMYLIIFFMEWREPNRLVSSELRMASG